MFVSQELLPIYGGSDKFSSSCILRNQLKQDSLSQKLIELNLDIIVNFLDKQTVFHPLSCPKIIELVFSKVTPEMVNINLLMLKKIYIMSQNLVYHPTVSGGVTESDSQSLDIFEFIEFVYRLALYVCEPSRYYDEEKNLRKDVNLSKEIKDLLEERSSV